MMRALRSLFLFAALVLLPAGCAWSPTIDIFGSYFPAWMVCIVSGIALTLVARLLFTASGIHAHLFPKSLVYPCMTIFFTLAVWLIFFKN